MPASDVFSAGWLSDHLSDVSRDTHAGNVEYFSDMRDRIRHALDDAGRDPDDFTYAAQVNAGADGSTRRAALDAGRRLQRAGADHVIGMPGRAAPDVLEPMAREVAVPLLEAAAL